MWLSTAVTYVDVNDEERIVQCHLSAKTRIIQNVFQIGQILEEIVGEMDTRSEHTIREKSGLVLKQIDLTQLNLSEHNLFGLFVPWIIPIQN